MRRLIRRVSVLGLVSLLSAAPVFAQNLPGTSLDDSGLSVDVKTLFELAEQAYPTLFANTSGWRSHGGYTYQYYAASGIYAGVKDGKVFLLGGPFGTSIVEKGALTAAIGALQNTIAKQQAANNNGGSTTTPGTVDPNRFTTLQSFKTAADLAATFKVINFETSTKLVTPAIQNTGQVKLEYVGDSSVEGVAATELLVTISGNGGTVPYSMWVDSNGKILRLIHNLSGIEYAPATAQAVGSGLVSGFLLFLTTATSPTLSAAIADLQKNPAFSSHVSKKPVGKYELDVLTVDITAANGDKLTWEVADFGSFTMVIRWNSQSGNASNSLELLEVELR